MKKYLIISMLMILNTSSAQFVMEKHSINSGGGDTMSGGGFSLKSSIGQVDVSNTMIGGTFGLTGGFWQPSAPINTTELIFSNGFE